jgi:ArsR family transcriptional regulator, lead/cadmium/zinc/bismuth-responsive transcriptional repressor
VLLLTIRTLTMNDNKTCLRIFADEAQIRNCREQLHSTHKSFSRLSNVLSLAGNEVRLKILFLINQEGELCPCDLADILEMSISAISQHLRKMKDGQLLNSNRVGQTIFYSVNSEQLAILSPLFSHLVVGKPKEIT